MHGPNPSIAGEAIRKALGTDQVASATRRRVSDTQAALDEAELRELEHDLYFHDPAGQDEDPAGQDEPQPTGGARRSFIDRLRRR